MHVDITDFAPVTSMPIGDLVFDLATAGPPDGDPVVLLHGFPETHACWQPLAPLLTAAGLRVYAPDQRGYSPGARPGEVEAYRIEHLVADVVGPMDALGLARAHLVGHDWGAIVGWFAAAWHPERVRTLTAVSVPHPAAFGWALANDADQQQRSAYITAFRKPDVEHTLLADDAARLRATFGDAVEPQLVEQHLHRLREPGALTAALAWYRAMTPEFATLGRVTVPTTHAWSDGDDYLGRAGAGRCCEFVSGPYLFAELPGVSHWVPEQTPHRLAEEVLHRSVPHDQPIVLCRAVAMRIGSSPHHATQFAKPGRRTLSRSRIRQRMRRTGSALRNRSRAAGPVNLPLCQSRGAERMYPTRPEETIMARSHPLDGAVCLVTGGGRGIGKAAGLALVRAGAAVAVAARTSAQLAETAREIRNEGGTALPIETDVTSPDACHAMVKQTVTELGRLDMLLCNAGGGLIEGRLVDSDPDSWTQTITLNLNSVFHCCQAAIPAMARQGTGKILVMGSGAGHAATPGMSAYAVAKAGASHLVRVLAQEVWRDGIDVNEIVPGPVATELTRGHFTLDEAPRGAKSERVKSPDEVADLVLWLATRRADGPTGQAFSFARRPL